MPKDALKLLLIQKNDSDIKKFKEELKAFDKTPLLNFDIEISVTTSFFDADTYLLYNLPDVIVLDLDLISNAPVKIIENFNKYTTDFPIILLTGSENINVAVKALQGGYQDYLLKNELNGNTLARSIRYSIERHKLISIIRSHALLDELTHTYNRRGFNSLAEKTLSAMKRASKPGVLLFADLNGLKQINDNFGHKEGDNAIISAARILQESIRTSDIVARIGGDEFIILLAECPKEKVYIVIDRINNKFENFNNAGNLPYKVSLSLGYTTIGPESKKSVDELILEADQAMYEIKQAGSK